MTDHTTSLSIASMTVAPLVVLVSSRQGWRTVDTGAKRGSECVMNGNGDFRFCLL